MPDGQPLFVAPQVEDWRIFHGEASPAEARIYVQMRLRAATAGLTLSGVIQGPTSAFARTLQATTRFVARPQGDEALAEVILPDPCSWTPALPYLYTAEIRLEHEGAKIWSDRRTFGIRRLGARGSRLYFDAQNWVLRGAVIRDPESVDWAAFREQDLALVVDSPTEDFCAEADGRGLLVVARCSETSARVIEQLAVWQRHPSVAIAVLDARADLPTDRRNLAPNLLLAARLSPDDLVPPDWADLTWMLDADLSGGRPANDPLSIPRVIERATVAGHPSEARSACDAMQRDWAIRGEMAGFVSGG